MEDRLTIVSLGQHTRLLKVLLPALCDVPYTLVSAADANDLQNKRVLFAVSADAFGQVTGLDALLRRLRQEQDAMQGSVGALLLDGQTELYTKDLARTLLFDANRAGCALLGRSLVEATGSLQNYTVRASVEKIDLFTAYARAANELVKRLQTYAPTRYARPKLLLLHASNRASSNTLALGFEAVSRLKDACDVTVVSLCGDAIYDCNGCTYHACTHFAQQKSCFYGGFLPNTVFPAIDESDAAILCVPNYNDAPGAYFLALNNRLNALLLRESAMRERALFAIVVSGYSGGDLVAKQLLGGYCLNKPFALPPRFALLETANDPDTVLRQDGVGARLNAFAANVVRSLCGA